MSSGNNLGFHAKFSDKSLTYIKNNGGQRNEPCETRDSVLPHE